MSWWRQLADCYAVTIQPTDGDAFVATCPVFPSLSYIARTPVEAHLGYRDLLADVFADLRAQGEPIPDPSGD